MNINATSTAAAGLGMNQSRQTRPGSISGGPGFDMILEDFKKVAFQRPAERVAEGVLEKHGLTREGLEKLPQAQKNVIMREIEEAVRLAVGVKDRKSPSQMPI